jgi:hypothetical protein
MKLNVMKYLDCSTGHISKETKNWLESVSGTNAVGQTIASYEFGFFISVPPTLEAATHKPAWSISTAGFSLLISSAVTIPEITGWELYGMRHFNLRNSHGQRTEKPGCIHQVS